MPCSRCSSLSSSLQVGLSTGGPGWLPLFWCSPRACCVCTAAAGFSQDREASNQAEQGFAELSAPMLQSFPVLGEPSSSCANRPGLLQSTAIHLFVFKPLTLRGCDWSHVQYRPHHWRWLLPCTQPGAAAPLQCWQCAASTRAPSAPTSWAHGTCPLVAREPWRTLSSPWREGAASHSSSSHSVLQLQSSTPVPVQDLMHSSKPG